MLNPLVYSFPFSFPLGFFFFTLRLIRTSVRQTRREILFCFFSLQRRLPLPSKSNWVQRLDSRTEFDGDGESTSSRALESGCVMFESCRVSGDASQGSTVRGGTDAEGTDGVQNTVFFFFFFLYCNHESALAKSTGFFFLFFVFSLMFFFLSFVFLFERQRFTMYSNFLIFW